MNGSCELQIRQYQLRIVKILCVLVIFCGSIYSIKAQSNDQSFPTPITSAEISGRIPARDIGDARLTEFFYVFNATQGDVFVNVVTKNLNGDIDVFTADNLRPLTKITVYADTSDNETGRVIYLRQPAKLILRIEGRSPNDDAATFRIKFAGSFAPASDGAIETKAPTVKTDNQTDVRVNSVGTIIEIKPKPTPQPKETIAESNSEKSVKAETSKLKNVTKKPKNQIPKPEVKPEQTAETETQPTTKPADEMPTEAKTETVEPEKKEVDVTENTPIESDKKEIAAKEEKTVKIEPKKTENPKSVKPLPPAALENIRLIILFKDNTKIERPMSEVLKVGVDKGILTVITKDGTIGRYSILDVEKMTIE